MPITPIASNFTKTYVGFNCPQVSSRFRWSFQPGMLFQDNDCWWKSARRAHPHKGVDFCGFHAGRSDEVRRVGADLVPSLYDGVVIKINDDFLGKTVWIRHRSIRSDQLILFSALGHIIPDKAIAEGSLISQGEAVGRVAPEKKGALLAMHLHLSVFWAPSFFKTERLCWQDLSSSRMIRLFDPLSIISRSV
jgi:hypothetical protein